MIFAGARVDQVGALLCALVGEDKGFRAAEIGQVAARELLLLVIIDGHHDVAAVAEGLTPGRGQLVLLAAWPLNGIDAMPSTSRPLMSVLVMMFTTPATASEP